MSPRSDKRLRQRAILDLLRRRPVSSQAELAEALAREGHRVTQSTLSLDLRELRVARSPTADGYRYRPPGEVGPAPTPAGMRGIAAAEVVGIDANENLVVVRTQIGRASGVAAFLDTQRLEGILATLAGDDTILIVPRRVADIDRVVGRLRDLLAVA